MKVLLTTIFCSLVLSCFSQSVISGKCETKDGQPAAFGSISILNPETNKIIAFKSIDAKGHYSLTFQSDLPKVLIKFSLINYEPESKIIENKSQKVDFIVTEKPTQLENVNIKPKMVYQKGDTIVHDVSQFANSNDRTLSDVIKKIPGVEVDESGKIKYQGKDINQFNVEGRDLMQGQYGIIPNSIPYGDVDKFEIIQNNQPVRMLKNTVPSDAAGINIKLKKNVSITGSGTAGAGFSPFLWTARLTPMLLTKKQQALVSLKSNNVGEDVGADLNTIMFSSGFEGTTRDVSTGNFLNTAKVSPPSQVDRQRYWFNESHAASVNFLLPTPKDWEIKNNTVVIDHTLNLTGSRETTINSIDAQGKPTTISYSRFSGDKLHQLRVKSTMTFNKNTEKNFFRDNLTFIYNRMTDNTSLFTNQLPAPQHTNGSGYSFQNSFSTLFALDKRRRHTINFQSYIGYTKDPQTYLVDSLQTLQFTNPDMQLATAFRQATQLESFNTNAVASIGLSKWKWEFRPTVKLNYSNDNFTSAINTFSHGNEKEYGYPWANNLQFSQFKSTGELGVFKKSERLSVSLTLPVSNYSLLATEKNAGMKKELTKFVLEPNSFIQYTLNSKFKLNAMAARGYSFSDVRSIYPGFVFSGLNFSAYDGPIAVRQTRIANGGLVYKNILKNIDANIGYNYSEGLSNTILSQGIDNNGQQILIAKAKNNKSANNGIGTAISKYINRVATSIQLGYNYGVSKAENLVNDELFSVKNVSNSVSGRIENASLSWLVASYKIAYLQGKRKGAGTVTKSESVTQNFKLVISPAKVGSLIASYDVNQYLFSNQHFFNQFLDVSYRYTLGKRKTDIELKWMNVLNTKEFQQVLVSAIQTDLTSFKLRPAQMLLTVRMNLRK